MKHVHRHKDDEFRIFIAIKTYVSLILLTLLILFKIFIFILRYSLKVPRVENALIYKLKITFLIKILPTAVGA